MGQIVAFSVGNAANTLFLVGTSASERREFGIGSGIRAVQPLHRGREGSPSLRFGRYCDRSAPRKIRQPENQPLRKRKSDSALGFNSFDSVPAAFKNSSGSKLRPWYPFCSPLLFVLFFVLVSFTCSTSKEVDMRPTSKTGLPLGIRKPLGNQAEFGGQGVLFCPLTERQNRLSVGQI